MDKKKFIQTLLAVIVAVLAGYYLFASFTTGFSSQGRVFDSEVDGTVTNQ